MLENIFDSHAHYDDKRFAADYNEIISSFQNHGIAAAINVAATLKSCQIISEQLTQKYNNIYGSVGIHPHYVGKLPGDYIDTLRTYVQKNSKIVAIGEIGLDYHYDDAAPKDVQIEHFRKQIELAQSLYMPIIVHSREATHDTLEVLREFRPQGVVHCFSSSKETAKKIIDLGMYIGFTGTVTFKNAKKVLDAVKVVPLDRILIETDCPYMAPEPHRGKRCDSTMLHFTAEKIAELKEVDPQTLINHATENTCKLFKIKTPG